MDTFASIPPSMTSHSIGESNFLENQFNNIRDENPNELELLDNIKDSFVKNNFMTKYSKILTQNSDPLIKTENIKLSSAIIIKTLKNYFDVDDTDDESQVSQLLDDIINDNVELSIYLDKLNRPNETDNDLDEIDEMLEDMGVEPQPGKKIDKISEELRLIREEKAHEKASIELNKLLKKRENMLLEAFKPPDTTELDKIFKTMTKSNVAPKLYGVKRYDNEGLNDIDESEDEIESDWSDIDSMFKEYNISPDVIDLLTKMNHFKKELNDTHQKFISIQNTIDMFNNTIVSQLEWLKTMPSGFDSDIITNNIKETIESRFNKDDIASLFKEYKNTYMKMMLLVSFAPRPFIQSRGAEDCSVCLSAPKNIVLIPCGHTCCSSCSDSLSSCMVCRAKIEKKQKIFDC